MTHHRDKGPSSSRDIIRLTRGTERDYSPQMSKTFRQAFLEMIEHRGLSLKSVAEGAGVSYEQLKKLKQRETQSANVEDAKKLADYLGVRLESLLEDPTAASPIEIAEVYNSLTLEERRVLLAAARGLVSQRQDDTQ